MGRGCSVANKDFDSLDCGCLEQLTSGSLYWQLPFGQLAQAVGYRTRERATDTTKRRWFAPVSKKLT